MLSGLSLLLASEARAVVQRHVRATALLVAAVVMLVMALGFALAALHAWLSLSYTTIQASLMIAGGLGVAAVAFFAAALIVRRARTDRSPIAATALVMAPTAVKLVASRVNFATLGIVGIVAAGALLGRRLAKD